jgi:hypothetical protein
MRATFAIHDGFGFLFGHHGAATVIIPKEVEREVAKVVFL